MWAAKPQRIANSGLSAALGVPEDKAKTYRDQLFDLSFANKQDNMEKLDDPWIVFTDKGRTYAREKGIPQRIPIVEKYGLHWNEHVEPVCPDCVVPLAYHDERAMKCRMCGTEYPPNLDNKPMKVEVALKLQARGRLHQ